MRKRVDDPRRRDFVRRLRDEIRNSGLPQNEIARRIGHSGQMLSDVLTKGQLPGGEAMMRLPDVLGVSADWLLMGKGSRVPVDARPDVAFLNGGQTALLQLRLILEDLLKKWPGGATLTAPSDEASTAARAVAAATARRKAEGSGGSGGQRRRPAG